MQYLSICSGIEAATVAWHPLGWQPLAFSEIEPFPSAVLAHHWSDVPNLSDMTHYGNWPSIRPDLVVGGTPCQAFSVAGLRKGLADPRGNLTLTFLAILARYRPSWVVWENVPGVLSDKTGAFGAFLGGLAELGYGWSYRVLDAQYFGVPQRRRRVFVVGHLGDWRRAAAVLFERESLLRHSPPSREKGQTAPTIPSRSTAGGGLETDFDCDGGLIPSWWDGGQTAQTLDAVLAKGQTMPEKNRFPAVLVPLTTHTLRAESYDASEDGTGRGTPLVPVAHVQIMPAMTSGGPSESSHNQSSGQMRDNYIVPVAFPANMSSTQCAAAVDLAPNLQAKNPTAVQIMTAVRRLTPRECERLQGFPDDHTRIPWRGKHADDCPDGPRYKALGNSMAVPVMRWIGERINLINALSK